MKVRIQYLHTEADTLAFGAKIAQILTNGSVLFLYGPLGSGKTTLTRGFLRSLGFNGKVKSPTYTLVEPYEIGERIIFHFDFYRVQDSSELRDMGIQEYFSANSICLIEWPEKGFPLLPCPDLACYIDLVDHGREVRIEACSQRGEECLKKIDS